MALEKVQLYPARLEHVILICIISRLDTVKLLGVYIPTITRHSFCHQTGNKLSLRK